jgi:hypothetical protein
MTLPFTNQQLITELKNRIKNGNFPTALINELVLQITTYCPEPTTF